MDWWEKLLQWITDHKDALGWLFGTGVATALLTGLYKLVRWLIEARRRRQLRPRHGPFVVLPPGSDLLPVLLPDPTDSPLSDYRIPYLERQPGRSVRREIEDLLREKGALLVLGKSGIGKTREAAHLAQMLNSEGWTVLYLPPDAYLEPPASLPSGCPARKILLFLDDLNRRCYAARREVSPRAEESLAMPLTEPFQRRLQKTLEVFEAFCGKGELLILATARNEQTPEYEGEPAEWDKLEWDRYPDLWKRFALYELPEPAPEVSAELLTELGQAAGVRVEDPETLARRNDGTMRNLVENLRMAANPERGLPALTPETFRDTLRGTWAERYRRAVARYPEARYLYWAAALLRRYGFPLAAYTILPLARALMRDGWRAKYRDLPRALRYLEQREAIYNPRDGQLEAAESFPSELLENAEQYLLALMIKNSSRFPRTEWRNVVFGLIMSSPNPSWTAVKAIWVYFPKEAFIATASEILSRLRFRNMAERLLKGAIISGTDVNVTTVALVVLYAPKLVPLLEKYIDESAPSLIILSVWYLAQGEKNRSAEAAQKARNLKPRTPWEWYTLGNIYAVIGHSDEAEEAYQQAIALDEKDPSLWSGLGDVYALREEWERALEAFQRAVELAPEDGAFRASLAGALQALGREEEAREELEQARPLMERENEYNRACFAALCGDTEEALRLLEVALQKRQTSPLCARQDPDLRSLHSDPRFWQIVAQNESCGKSAFNRGRNVERLSDPYIQG